MNDTTLTDLARLAAAWRAAVRAGRTGERQHTALMLALRQARGET